MNLVLVPLDGGHDDPAVTLIWRDASLVNPALATLLQCF